MSSKPVSSGGKDYVESSGMVRSRNEAIFDVTWRMSIVAIAIFFGLFPVLFIASSAFNPSGSLSTSSLLPSPVEVQKTIVEEVEDEDTQITLTDAQAIDAEAAIGDTVSVWVSDPFKNFRDLMFNPEELAIFPFWNWIANSFIVATTTTILALFITMIAAYAFSRFRFAFRRQLLLGILLIQVFPNLLAMVALFLIVNEIGRLSTGIPEALPFLDFIDWSFLNIFGLNSLGGLILVYLGGAMGINTWLMKGFFDTVPRDIDESAKVDGATAWQTFWMLIFPLVRPILAVVGVLAFVGTFNEFILARILLRDKQNWTLMVGLFQFINADFNKDWGKFAAGALVSGIPVVALYLALQDQIVGGLTQGAVK